MGFRKLASNASMRILAYFCEAAHWPAPQKRLLVTFPQTPEIVNKVDGCAFKER